MPFKSKAQVRFMYATHPGIARRWTKHTSRQTMRNLPERLKRHTTRKLVGHRTPYKRRQRSGRRQR
jgi:hypothetical protein